MNKRITLCADDYAQNTAISEGIVRLIKHGRINATSCMVSSPAWNETHPSLHPLQQATYIGLHFNLTHGNALSSAWKKYYGRQLPKMTQLLKQSYMRQLNSDVVSAEIKAQLDAYTHAMNAYPDFIDGHQHIHQLPVIREALLAVYATLSPNVFIRKTNNGWQDVLSIDGFPKRQLIALLGGITFRKRLQPLNIPTNSSFSGIYNFQEAHNYRNYIKQFLNHSQDGGLIMCHPGNLSEDADDPLRSWRHHELAYFMSDNYLTDLKNYSCQLKHKEENSHGDK